MSPPMTTMAMGARKLGSAPSPRATGSMPAPMAMVVMTMGRARLRQASRMASRRGRPRSRRATMAYSTRRMEFLVTMPMSMRMPIIEDMEKLFFVSSRARKAPPSDRGKAARMVKGCKKSWNNSTRTA